jgi:L-asparaginase
LALINAVPQILNVSNIASVRISDVGSKDISSTILINLTKEINKVVSGDPTRPGAVVTYGTDALEESAIFLHATVNCGKPVVVVGAMRPATATLADGTYNLLEAVTVTATPASRNRGAIVVLNDRIASPDYVVELDTSTLDTFKALEMGYLSEIISDKPFYFYPPVTPTGKTTIDISKITSIPRVDILYSYQDMHNDTLYNAI